MAYFTENILLNKSFLTNTLAAGLVVLGYSVAQPTVQLALVNIGLFALSGSLTNWIAVYMLFEKVPGFYGSGVIENRFQDLRNAIGDLIRNQFFTKERLAGLVQLEKQKFADKLPELAHHLDYDAFYQALVESIMGSSLGGMLQMVGGPRMLEPMKPKFQEAMQRTLVSYLQGDVFKSKLDELLGSETLLVELQTQLSTIVTARLEEMTPKMVKGIMEQMMARHLGWLVVWGGVFGGLIGLVKTFI
jgi:uncharacterized membrane protein YheB (UPF0754 family)